MSSPGGTAVRRCTVAITLLVAVGSRPPGAAASSDGSEAPGLAGAPPRAWVASATLHARRGAANDRFGESVALSADGTRAVIGASFDDTAGGEQAGTARVFVRDGTRWSEEATLAASDAAQHDGFGIAVAIAPDASRIIVGASYDDTPCGADAGSARVFVRSGTAWTEEGVLVASDGMAEDRLGFSVALASDASRAIVGAFLDDAPAANGGSARVFSRTGTTWSEEATLVASDGASDDVLGFSVALAPDASWALVGAARDDGPGGESDAGSVRVFARNGTVWSEGATLRTPNGVGLGTEIALSSDRALFGASGTAHVFTRTGTTWSETAALAPPSSAVGFGESVAMSSDGRRVLVGAPYDDGGSVLPFVDSGSGLVAEPILRAGDAADDDHFGESVAVSSSGDLAIVGAWDDDTPRGADSGSAWVFVLRDEPD